MENKIKNIDTLSNKNRLNLIREIAGEEAVKELDEAVSKVLSHASPALTLLTDFFTLLDSPKEDITGTYPAYTTEGRKLNIIQNTHDLESAILSLKHTKIIGFDSEQKPTFKKGEKQHGVALIQLATPTACHLIQVKQIKDLSSLMRLIEDENIVKVGVNLVGDKQALYEEFRVKMRGTIDIDGVLTRLTSHNSIGAKKAATIFLKRNLQKSKKMSISNWEDKTLSQNQIKYAAEDACVAYDVTVHLLNTYPFVHNAMPPWFVENFKELLC